MRALTTVRRSTGETTGTNRLRAGGVRRQRVESDWRSLNLVPIEGPTNPELYLWGFSPATAQSLSRAG